MPGFRADGLLRRSVAPARANKVLPLRDGSGMLPAIATPSKAVVAVRLVTCRYPTIQDRPHVRSRSVQQGGAMSHNKLRSSVAVGEVDWTNPHLSSLLEKADHWRLENRSSIPPQEVQIHVNTGWVTANMVCKPAQVLANNENTMVLATRFPVSRGERLRVDSQGADGTHVAWGRVIDEREGHRAEDREHGVFLNWLRLDD